MPRIDLSLSVATGVAALLFLGSLAIAYLYYRTTLPPVSPLRRLVLGTLRGGALFLTAVMLLEPLVRIVHTSMVPPSLAVLIDNSQSMTLANRGELLRSELSAIRKLQLPDGGIIHYYLFGSSLSTPLDTPPDSLTLSEEATDLSGALASLREQAQENNVRAVILLTDGASNTGDNPVYEAARMALPVFPVAVGDSAHPRDLAVTKIQSNQTVYEGLMAPVDVTLRGSGFPGESVEVSLLDEGTRVDRATIELAPGVRDHTVRLHYRPEGAGTHRISVRAAELRGEATGRNNALDFFARVLKGRLRILTIGGAPSPDLSTIRATLRDEGSFVVEARTGRKSGGYYEGPLSDAAIDSADCLLLIGFPSAQTSAADAEQVHTAIERGKPALFLAGPSLSAEELRKLSPLLGISVQSISPSEELVFLQPASAERNNPILNPAGGGLELWDRLPPVFRSATRIRPLPGATVLAVSKIQDVVLNDPLLVTYRVQPVRTASLFAYGIWRWKLMGSSHPDTREHLAAFLPATIRWLTTDEADRGVNVRTSKEFYPQGEAVDFVSEAYDATARPVDNATIRVTVTSGERSVDLSLSPIGSGRYEGLLHGLAPGEYRYRAVGTMERDTIGADTGRFSVGELNLEFRDTRMDAALLRRLAHTTGGQMVLPGETPSLQNAIGSIREFRPSIAELADRVELWNWPYTLAIVLLLFAAEWVIRKQSGMT